MRTVGDQVMAPPEVSGARLERTPGLRAWRVGGRGVRAGGDPEVHRDPEENRADSAAEGCGKPRGAGE